MLGPSEALAQVNYAKGVKPPGEMPTDLFYIKGELSGAVDNSYLGGDFFLQPDGTHSYTNALGAKATVAAYRLIAFGSPMTPADFAAAVESGKLRPVKYSESQSGTGKSIVHVWKAAPLALQFKPLPKPQKIPGSAE